LADHPNIIGIKEASGDLEQCREIAENKKDDFLLLSGDDRLTLPIIKMGGKGVISVIANFLPKEFGQMTVDALLGNWDVAEIMDSNLQEMYDLMSEEGNPTSVKTALNAINLCDSSVRLPLVEGSVALEKKILEKYRQIKKG
jgi:4-hydroxy-tetrahydrodipicolinate synthase